MSIVESLLEFEAEQKRILESCSLVEENMTLAQAMDVLGVSSEILGDEEEIKKAYKKAAMVAHPDRGGTEDAMKKVNAAYELLSRAKGGAKTTFDWEALNEKYRQLAIVVKDYFKREVDVKAFLEHLRKFDPTFEVTEKMVPDSEERTPHGVEYTLTFKSEDGKRRFIARFYTSLSNIAGSATLGATEISLPTMITTSVYVDGKDQKIKRSNYEFSSNKKMILDPEEVFPSDRLKKFFSGEARKGSKFQKRDMFAALSSELGAKSYFDGKSWAIPVKEIGEHEITLDVDRTVLMKIPAWTYRGIFKKRKEGYTSQAVRESLMMGSKYFQEDYSFIEILKGLVSKLKNMDTVEEMIPVVKEAFSQKKEESKEFLSKKMLEGIENWNISEDAWAKEVGSVRSELGEISEIYKDFDHIYSRLDSNIDIVEISEIGKLTKMVDKAFDMVMRAEQAFREITKSPKAPARAPIKHSTPTLDPLKELQRLSSDIAKLSVRVRNVGQASDEFENVQVSDVAETFERASEQLRKTFVRIEKLIPESREHSGDVMSEEQSTYTVYKLEVGGKRTHKEQLNADELDDWMWNHTSFNNIIVVQDQTGKEKHYTFMDDDWRVMGK
jgi:hypothetical protein